MTHRLLLVAAASVLFLISGLATALPAASAASTVAVSIPPGSGSPAGAPGFAPDTVTVVIGVNNTVTWTNNDFVSGKATFHDVAPVSQPTGGNWSTAGSGNMVGNATYSFTFTVAGTYTYYCTYHTWMTGTVVVKAATTPAPEFPAASLALIFFAVIAAVMVATPRLRPRMLPSS